MRTISSVLSAVASVACFAATATAASNDVVAVVDPKSGQVILEVGGDAYLESVDVSTRANGKLYTTADGSLGFAGTSAFSGEDTFGPWNSTVMTWSAGSVPFVTTVRQYGSGGGERGD